MTEWWFSSTRMTVLVLVDAAGIVRGGATIIRVFRGQPITNLYYWMKRQGGLRTRKL